MPSSYTIDKNKSIINDSDLSCFIVIMITIKISEDGIDPRMSIDPHDPIRHVLNMACEKGMVYGAAGLPGPSQQINHPAERRPGEY